jgi:hypothetical protein
MLIPDRTCALLARHGVAHSAHFADLFLGGGDERLLPYTTMKRGVLADMHEDMQSH